MPILEESIDRPFMARETSSVARLCELVDALVLCPDWLDGVSS